MTDMEKVVKGIKAHMNSKCVCMIDEIDNNEEELCPYWKCDDCSKRMLNDALELLKESETAKLPVRPVYYADSPYLYEAFHCGKCGNRINYHSPYCSNCGKAVKWDD